MGINALKDAVKALAQSLQVSTVFPAGLFVLVNTYLVLPHLLPDIDLQSPITITIVISLSLILSYTLYAFNFPLIRVFEGYKLREIKFVRDLLIEKREKFKHLQKQIEHLQTERQRFKNRLGFESDNSLDADEKNEWQALIAKLAYLERELDRHYPSMHQAVLPTRLGNAIAAFEDYSKTRYGMDSIALWPRLVPLLRDMKYLDFVTQEKSVFDFLLNTCIVVAVLGLELVYLYLFLGRLGLVSMIVLFTVVACYALYNGMIIAARQWGTTVRVAFDLYRHDLHQRLGLLPAKDFKEEFNRWQQISRFLLYRREDVWFQDFIPQSRIVEMKNQDKKE